MAKLLYNLSVATSKYQDRDGKERTNWENIGSMFENERNGKVTRFITLKTTFNPAGLERKQGSDHIIISLFPPRDKEQQQSETQNSTVGQVQAQDSGFGQNIGEFPF